jgi:uncharacterized protein YhjY with autotransporter beta-barrel domain
VGIFAQSVGGGGGNGGASSSTSQSGSSDSGVSVNASLGGKGGGGGVGGAVNVSTVVLVETLGDQSSAIYAQSVGGGGGFGGASSGKADSGAFAATFALGGSGGTGGKGGAVSVYSTGPLITSGAMSYGVFSQSVGGGGGAAGSSSTMSAGAGTANLSLAMGGSGGAAQDGGGVAVVNNGSIVTGGASANGIFAQSVGGGGGVGGASTTGAASGKNSATLAMGGSGSSGGAGTSVSVSFSNAITTSGANAAAILAQSVGGGGGSGGSSNASSAANGDLSASLALGGKGSGAGSAGSVNVSNTVAAAISTAGDNASAIVAQSIGGGGGSGGSTSAGAGGNATVAASLALGGAGGGGGNGGAVTVAMTDTGSAIHTAGINAFGVLAQSVGGGGGSGAVAVASASSSIFSASVSGSLGGSGGSGGTGGVVSLSSYGNVFTTGLNSVGLVAQSVGGGGGVAAAATSSSSLFTGTMALGGSGGSGGVGGDVKVNAIGSVTTASALSAGIVAQSIGGGGGLSLVRASNVVLGGATSAGSAGLSAAVMVASGAAITTSGGASVGIVAQSIAGGGGLATSTGSATLGGPGGNSSAVNLCKQLSSSGACVDTSPITGSITTQGAAALGILAQSVGGGGGAVLSPDSAVVATFKAGTGYTGGVTVMENTAITTGGAGAVALLAQSVGGGGGSVIASYNQASNSSYAASLGGSVGGGNSGGSSVYVTTKGQALSTAGANASAIIAQSVGNGGGYYSASNAGTNSSMSINFSLGAATTAYGDGSNVSVALGGVGTVTPIATLGANSFGVVAQSFGGGGGMVSFADAAGTSTVNGTVSGALGGTSGTGINGAVNVYGSASIATSGLQSLGLLAQTISGGGGVAVASSSAASVFTGTVKLGSTSGGASSVVNPVAVNLTSGSITTTGAMSPAIVAQDIGGGGGLSLLRASNVWLGGATSSGSAAVTVTSGAAITTSGAASIGIVAQSIAGGGGLAISTSTATLGGGAPGGTAGAVTVTSSGAIKTSGVNAVGILAQSVGGGGGAVLSTGETVVLSGWPGTGNAGAVTVNVNAPITTTGAGAYGVIAQSVRGGGGLAMNGSTMQLWGGNAGSSGLVTVNVAAGVSISATGQGAVGIKTWSSTDPIVNIAAGASVTGGSGGSAVAFDGPSNELNNSGSVSTLDGVNGMAVHSLSGDTTVRNSGTLQGNLKLALGGNNLAHNLSTGSMITGASLDLGGTGLLQNDGVMQSGLASTGKTLINGALQQSESGSMAVRYDAINGSIDSFQATGSGKLRGTLRPTILNSGKIVPGTILATIFSADGGLDVSGLSLSIRQTAIMNYALSTQGGGLGLSVTANFSPGGLAVDGQKIGKLIGYAQSSGLPILEKLTAALVEIPTVEQLDQAYWNVSGAGASSMSKVTGQLTKSFMRVMLNPFGSASDSSQAGIGLARNFGTVEKQNSSSAASAGAPMAKDPRANFWVQTIGDSNKTDADPSAPGADLSARAYGLATGVDYRTADGATVGFALGDGGTSFSLSNGLNGRSNAFQMGLYGSKQYDATYVSAALTYAAHHMTTTRALQLIGATYAADFQASNLGARLQAGYRLGTPLIGVTPYAALQMQKFTTPAYKESAVFSAPHLALNYDERSDTSTRGELGARFDMLFSPEGAQGLAVRTRVAWAHDQSTNPDVTAGFQTLAEHNFSVGGTAPVANLLLLSAGVELRLSNRVSIGANFDGEFSGRSRTYSATGVVRYDW